MQASVTRPRGASAIPRVLHVALCLTVFVAALHSARANDAADRFSVATYNARFLMDVFDDPYTNDEKHEPKPRHELESLGRAIRHLNADIVALQELENEGTLKALAVEHLAGMGYRQVVVQETNSVHGQNLGVLSRYPILSVTSHRHRSFGLPGDGRRWHFARDLMHVRVRVAEAHHLNLFVVHLKSKRDSEGDPESADWRRAEAMAARRIISAVMAGEPDGWFLLVGDMNDLPRSAPLRALMDAREGRRLVDLHAHLPASRRVTYRWGRHRSTIDYILAGPALAARVAPGSPRVLADDALLAGSDHAPVSAAFLTRGLDAGSSRR